MIKKIRQELLNLYKDKEIDNKKYLKFQTKPEIGGIYTGILNDKEIIFIPVSKIGDYYECFKISIFFEFATISDIIIYDEVLGNYIIQTSLNFYLRKDEFSNFMKIDQLNKKLTKLIFKFRGLDLEEKLKLKSKNQEIKIGSYYPFGNKIIEKFKDEEFSQIENYHLRIFSIIDELDR